ncbi:LuxR C-terminal-related transcriptional regulator [Variovorax sp. J22P168]|uniref:LuxR C-terminal-related transcriptional regulator n=1 Tax=Variovorax jilinensis TaxID=3053513 RepID=UPI002576B861|nr:LuxR C-terminal-related transcriptional regulator [Variovorax sp. J22P168]MDM0015328.1 LuxR C-terminal-related transcriptional regulator [Variovorax sp. J22P168]
MARLVEARRQRCVVVLGQAGSGKTSTLVAWRQELLSLDFDVASLSLVPAHDQLQRFLRDLLTSIASVDASLLEEAGLLTEGVESDAEIERWIIALVQGIALRQRELVLMLDDLQHLREPRIFRAIQWLLDYAPARLHVALSSRTALPLSFERLRSRGLVTELDMRDLRFSADESERYLRGQLGRIDAGDARALHELTDGWVAGLQLFALDLRTKEGRSDAGYAPVRVRDAHAFASYFEREVLVHIAPDDLDMLTRVSVCSRFCVPLCASLLVPSQPLPRVRARLTRLEEDNFFITQTGGAEREPWYRLHPLLRETLLARIEQWPLVQCRALHVAACRWFIARGELEDAVHHAVQAGDMAQAVSLVEASAHDLLSSGELSQLAQLLRQLPGEAILQHFDLHLAQAYLAMYARDFIACDASLRQMEARQQTLDVRQRYDLLLLRCGLAAQQDRTDVVVGLLAALNDIPVDAKDLAWTSRANLLAWTYNHEGAYEQASHAFDDARHRNGAQLSALLGRCMLASSLRRQGKLSEAEQLAREVLRAAELRGAAFGGVACTSAAVLADVLYEIDEVEAAKELLESRVAATERLTLPGVVFRSLVTLAGCHRLSGRDEEAFAVIDRLEDYAARYRFDRILAQALEFRLRFHLVRGEPGEAVGIVQRLEALLHRQEDGGSIAARIADSLARARCDMALNGCDFASAAKQLKARTDAANQPLNRGAAELQVQGALASFGMGEPAAAREKLIEGLRIGHSLGLVRGLLDVSPELPRMLRALLNGADLEPVLAFHVNRLLAAADRTHAPSPATAQRRSSAPVPAAALSDREYEVLSLLAQAMPNKKIARVLDVSLDTVKFHLKNIYGKLGVAARDEAVARLRDLNASRESAGHAP